jgi:hypothetical protein
MEPRSEYECRCALSSVPAIDDKYLWAIFIVSWNRLIELQVISFTKIALSASPRSGAVSLARRFNALLLPKLLHGMALHIFSLRSRRQNKAWGGARQRVTPGGWRTPSSPRSGRQFFVIRAITIIEIASIAIARSAGWSINRPSYLGLRAVALHPRLYSVARIRGLGFDTSVRAKSGIGVKRSS